MACLVGGDGCDVSVAQVRLGGLGVPLPCLMVGAAFRAAVAGVGAGSGMAGVSKLGPVQMRLTQVYFFLKMSAADTAAAAAVWTGLLRFALSVQSLRL